MPETRTIGGDEMLAIAAAVLREHGAEGWLVGGSVRDLQLGCDSPDIDLAVTGDARAIAHDVARGSGLPWFALSERHGAFRVVGEHAHVDVAALRGGTIQADLAERDFTVNAMAMPVGPEGRLGDLEDPFGGLADLAARRLAAVSDRIFTADPLRLMRAARFAHVLGLTLSPALREAVRAQSGEVRRAAPERVATEMILTLDAGRAGDAARSWHGLGLLQAVVPEIPEHGQQAALFAALDRLEECLAAVPAAFPGAAPLLEKRLAEPIDGAVERRTALRFAGLLLGLSAGQALTIGRRLKLSGAMISLVETAAKMVQGAPLPKTAAGPGPGREAVLFLWASAPWEPEVVLLAAAAASATGDCGAGSAEALMDAWAAQARGGVPRLPFDGTMLMAELDLEPGPRLGRALLAARLVWEAGEATTAAEALAAARAALTER
jgi:poly(A) polymerase